MRLGGDAGCGMKPYVIATVPKVAQCDWVDAALRAKPNCPSARAERKDLDARPIEPAKQNKNMNAELVKKALEKVLIPQVLVNLVSQRVRQLARGGGGESRPLIADVANLGMADIALREIIEDKMSFEMPEIIPLIRPTARGRKTPQHWQRNLPRAA